MQEFYGEVQLYRRVLDFTLSDYLSPDEEFRREAEEWLCLDDPDFLDVCEFAEIDPEIVFKIFLYFKENL